MQLPKDYPYALTVALGMSLQLYLEGFAVSRVRKAVFNEEFMRKQFGETHRREIGTEIFLGGCPDTGSGLYSKRLSYKDWYKYNVAQRIHLNYVEGINFGQISLLSAALYRPKQAALVGLLYIVGRFVFKYSYKKYGPGSSGRIVGIVLFLLSVAVNSGIFLTNFIKSIK